MVLEEPTSHGSRSRVSSAFAHHGASKLGIMEPCWFLSNYLYIFEYIHSMSTVYVFHLDSFRELTGQVQGRHLDYKESQFF